MKSKISAEVIRLVCNAIISLLVALGVCSCVFDNQISRHSDESAWSCN